MHIARSIGRRIPVISKIVRFARRLSVGVGPAFKPVVSLASWIFTSREITNFTYDLSAINQRHLAAMVAHVTGTPYADIVRYIAELEHDVQLRQHIQARVKAQGDAAADSTARYGRRIGWYAIARAGKPQVIVETGIDKGLGSCVLTAALRRNSAEGFPGHYYGTDINPRAGYLLSGDYRAHGEILYGDSITSLRQLAGPINLFINDSDHSARYEAAEYQTVAAKLSERALILGDNAHVTDELLTFAHATGREFLFFREVPERHWYPGAGIGIAFVRSPIYGPVA